MIAKRDKEIYEWIKDYMLKNGYCPSVEEICDGVGIKSKSSVQMHIVKLEDTGAIIRKCAGSSVYRLAGMRYEMEKA